MNYDDKVPVEKIEQAEKALETLTKTMKDLHIGNDPSINMGIRIPLLVVF